jgi:Predicted membrane protein
MDVDDDDSISESNVTLSEQEAIDIATAEANGSVNEVEFENEDGTPVYEVELVTTNGLESEVAVHADDGIVLETGSEDEKMDEDSISESNVSLSEQEAIDIATAEANGTVDEVELKVEDGVPVYEVELVRTNGSETEVAIHADDGMVIEIESEEYEDEREDEEMDDEDEREDSDDE